MITLLLIVALLVVGAGGFAFIAMMIQGGFGVYMACFSEFPETLVKVIGGILEAIVEANR